MAAGWGIFGWNTGSWGDQGTIVQVNNPLDIAWGNLGKDWGYGNYGGLNNLPLSLSSVNVVIDKEVSVTGSQLYLSAGNLQAAGQAFVYPNGQQINISLNPVTPLIDVDVSTIGQQLNISQGEENVDVSVIVEGIGLQLNVSLGEESVTGTGLVDLTGQQLNISQGSVVASIDINAPVSSIYQVGWGIVSWNNNQGWGASEAEMALNIAEGIVDPSPDATVVGIGITVSLSLGTVVIGTGNVSLTGQQINIGQGTAIGDANTLASVTGLGLNIALGEEFAGSTVVVPVVGNGLTIALNNNNVNVQIWTEINTGTVATWTEIDTAA